MHCHNDFGLATANALTALEEGVTSPHVCVNGLGERAGNVPLEELAICLEHLYGIRTGLDLSRLYELSRLVEEISGVPVSPTKSVVGYNAFSHEAGIHTHGILAHTLTYEPVQPDVIGRQRRMILGKHTGKAALVEKLKERGMELPDPVLVDLLQRLKASAESRSKEELEAFLAEYRRLFEQPGISDEEFWKLVKEMGLGAQTA